MYHPRTDGQSECNNQWVETYLRFFVSHQQDNWATYLPIAEFAHNNWRSEMMKETPFFLLMGYHPCADGHDVISTSPLVEQRLNHLLQIRKDAQLHMVRAQQLWIMHKDTPKYKVRDQDQSSMVGRVQPQDRSTNQQTGPSTSWTLSN